MMQDVQIREATTADKKAVLSIRDDVYSGRDYLPAFYDNFMASPFTTGFVFLYKGTIVHFACATIIDGGETFASRAGRVSKECEGMGFSRINTEHMEAWAKQRGIYRKANVASETNLTDVIKPSFTMLHKHILTKECLQYQLDNPANLVLPINDAEKTRQLFEVTDSQLAAYINLESSRQYLFPKDRIVVNSVPYKVMESNIPVIREQKDLTVIFSDVRFNFLKVPRGMLSFGTSFPVHNAAHAYNIELYGSDSEENVRRHIVKHLLRLKEKTCEPTSVFVFVDEDFPFDIVDKVMLDLGIQKRLWHKQMTKRMMFEKSLVPQSQY